MDVYLSVSPNPDSFAFYLNRLKRAVHNIVKAAYMYTFQGSVQEVQETLTVMKR
jgi:hypothetical protein